MANVRKLRTQESRGANKRPEGWIPPNAIPDIPSNRKDPEFRYRWVRLHINSALEDKDSFFKRKQRGWEAVPASEIPEWENLKDDQGFLRRAGCVLCKIPAAIADEDVRFYEDQALGGLASAKAEYEAGGSHEYVPKFSESGKTRVIKGRLPSV